MPSRECDKVCKYIDLPLQHASDRVLQAHEAPRHPRAATKGCSQRIRERIPGVTLRTTFIVGFPGETDADFDELMDFVEGGRVRPRRRVHLLTRRRHDGLRPGRRRRRERKRRRQAALMARQRRSSRRRQSRRVGERARLLVDGPSPDHELVLRGRLAGPGAGHRPAGLPDRMRPSSTVVPGDFLDVEIVGAQGYDLIARPYGRVTAYGTRAPPAAPSAPVPVLK